LGLGDEVEIGLEIGRPVRYPSLPTEDDLECLHRLRSGADTGPDIGRLQLFDPDPARRAHHDSKRTCAVV
jgi:hypothetical protein